MLLSTQTNKQTNQLKCHLQLNLAQLGCCQIFRLRLFLIFASSQNRTSHPPSNHSTNSNFLFYLLPFSLHNVRFSEHRFNVPCIQTISNKPHDHYSHWFQVQQFFNSAAFFFSFHEHPHIHFIASFQLYGPHLFTKSHDHI